MSEEKIEKYDFSSEENPVNEYISLVKLGDYIGRKTPDFEASQLIENRDINYRSKGKGLGKAYFLQDIDGIN